MKKMTMVVLAFALCFGLTSRAFALSHSKQESLEVSYMGGSYNDILDLNGQVVSQDKVPVRGMDVNWDFHRRFLWLSYGLALRERSMNAPQGKLNFTGVGGRIGFVTNTFEDPHRWPIGFHGYLSAVIGSMTKIEPKTYDQGIVSSFSDADTGVDVMLHGWKSADGTKYRSALVASFDTSYEAMLTPLLTKGATPEKGFLSFSGSTPKFSLSLYW